MVEFKNRYMLLEVSIDKSLPLDDLHANLARAIKHSILLNFAECGLASSLASFQVKYLNPRTKLCIIRTSREEYQKVWSAITMVSRIDNFPASFNLLDLSVVRSWLDMVAEEACLELLECGVMNSEFAGLLVLGFRFSHVALMAGQQSCSNWASELSGGL